MLFINDCQIYCKLSNDLKFGRETNIIRPAKSENVFHTIFDSQFLQMLAQF